MAMYDVFIRQEFAGYKTIEASSEDEAIDLAWDMLNAGEIDPQEFDSETNVDQAELLSAKVVYLNERAR